MPTTIKMRVARVSEFDSAGVNQRQVQLTAVGRDGAPLDPANVLYATVDANFIDPFGAELEHDQMVDVSITVSAPA
jgi:hypothetical protein